MATAKESWPPIYRGPPFSCFHSSLATFLFSLSAFMEFYLLPLLAFLSLTLTAGDSDLPSEIYWNSVLPNTPMPQAVKNSLRPEESTGVEIGKGTDIGVSKGGVSVSTGHEEKPVYAGVTKAQKPNFFYRYAATEDQLHADPSVALFFLEKDMRLGTKMNLDFMKNTNEATFLPHQVATSIPFSSDKLPEILDQLSMKPESIEAETIKNTIIDCERPGIKGEEKYCATSLESMIDFSTSKLGNKGVKAVSTEVENKSQTLYRIAAGVEKMGGDVSVVCHKMVYAYAVFLLSQDRCLKGLYGSPGGQGWDKSESSCIVSYKYKGMEPKHLAFQLLKVKPGVPSAISLLRIRSSGWFQNRNAGAINK
ncbi:BURP domain protein RD22 [Vitis vinifera]|uniref:BURP domain protein RD22 n=1 Tax=Vitis vinifera TaxID=29760 RepID=A0A438FQ95_VITVI|nr:BURP domain protein RD22 [Vitis vinifera]